MSEEYVKIEQGGCGATAFFAYAEGSGRKVKMCGQSDFGLAHIMQSAAPRAVKKAAAREWRRRYPQLPGSVKSWARVANKLARELGE